MWAAAADVYLMWGDPLAAIHDRIQAMKSLVAATRRTDKVLYGLRINIMGMAIVGSYQQVADRLLAYIDLGITVLILSGYPHLEECENIGRNVLPLIKEGYLDR
jgi:hypothetical protein